MSEPSQDESRVTEGLASLAAQVERAKVVVAELRESNQGLRGEIAKLKSELESRPEPGLLPDPVEAGEDETSGAEEEREALRSEVSELRGERAAIREAVMKLLERVERLEG